MWIDRRLIKDSTPTLTFHHRERFVENAVLQCEEDEALEAGQMHGAQGLVSKTNIDTKSSLPSSTVSKTISSLDSEWNRRDIFGSLEEELRVLMSTIEWSLNPELYMLVDEYNQKLKKQLEILKSDIASIIQEETAQKSTQIHQEMKLLRWSNKMLENSLRAKIMQSQKDLDMETNKRQFFIAEIERLKQEEQQKQKHDLEVQAKMHSMGQNLQVSEDERNNLETVVQALEFKIQQLELEKGQKDLEMLELTRIAKDGEQLQEKIKRLQTEKGLLEENRNLDLNKYADENSSLRQAVALLEEDLARVDEITRELSAKKEKVRELVTENRAMKSKLGTLESKVAQLDGQNRMLECSKSSEIDDAREKLEVKSQQLKKAADDLSSAKSQLQTKSEEISKLHQKSSALQGKVRSLEEKSRELDGAKLRLQTKTQDLKTISDELKYLKEDLEKRTREAASASKEKNDLRKAIRSMETKTRQLVLENEAMDLKTIEFESVLSENAGLQSSVRSLEDGILKLQIETKDQCNKNDDLQRTVKRLEGKISDFEIERKKLLSQIEKNEKENQEYRDISKENETLASEVSQLRGLQNESLMDLKRLLQDRDTAKSKLEETNSMNESLRSSIIDSQKTYENRISELEEKLCKSQEETTSMSAQMMSLKSQLNEREASEEKGAATISQLETNLQEGKATLCELQSAFKKKDLELQRSRQEILSLNTNIEDLRKEIQKRGRPNEKNKKEKKQIVSDLEQKLSRTEHEASVMTAEIKALKGQLERKTAVEEQTRRGIQKVFEVTSKNQSKLATHIESVQEGLDVGKSTELNSEKINLENIDKINQLESDLKDEKAALVVLKENLTEKNLELQKSGEENTSLKNKVHVIEQEIQNTEAQNLQQINEYEQSISELAEKLSLAKHEASSRSLEVTSLKTQLERKITFEETAKKELRQEFEVSFEDQNKLYLAKIENIKRGHEIEMMRLKEGHSHLRQELNAEIEIKAESLTTIQNLEIEIEELGSAFEKELLILNSDLKESKEENESFIFEMKRMVPKFKCCVNLEDIAKEMLSFVEENESRNEELSETRDAVEGMRLKLTDMSEKMKNAEQHYQSTSSAIVKTNEKMEALRSELADSKVALVEQKQLTKKYEKQIDETVATISATNATVLNETEQALDNLCRSLGIIESEKTDICKKIEAVRNEMDNIICEKRSFLNKIKELTLQLKDRDETELKMMHDHEKAMNDLLYISGFIGGSK